MDRFKFRAWDKKQKKMYDFKSDWVDTFVLNDDGTWELGKMGYEWDVSGTDNQDGVLMQCTGLKDKNGKLIYEGDIVKVGENFSLLEEVIWKEGLGMVLYDRKKESKYFRHLDTISLIRSEVIGNIYENPELLTNNKEK